jgi:hypothetical protein
MHIRITAVLILILMMTSCKKDEGPSFAPAPDLSVQIQKRWDIGGAVFSSLEFNNSNQAMVVYGQSLQEPDSIRSYFYRILDSKTVDIKNFGKMEVSSISDTAIQFSFTPKSGTAISLNGRRAGLSVGNASNTSLLCRTWKLERFLEDGEPEFDFDTIGLLTVTFTTSGTYLLQGSLDIGDSATVDEQDASLSWWKWNPAAPGQKICYSHESEDFSCDSLNEVSIVSLTGTELILRERSTEFELSAYNLPGRVAVASGRKIPDFLKGNRFFFSGPSRKKQRIRSHSTGK